MLQPLKRKKLYEDIVDQILELIHNDVLKPGERLPSERIMSEQLKVGRPTVREALRAMENMGYLETRVGGGTYVRSLSLDQLVAPITVLLSKNDKMVSDIMEMRIIIENATARMAAERSSPEQRGAMAETLRRMESNIISGGLGCEEDNLFHVQIAEATGNAAIGTVFGMCRGLLAKAIAAVFERPNEPRTALEEHKLILAAIDARDSEAAAKAMKDHLYRAAERICGAEA